MPRVRRKFNGEVCLTPYLQPRGDNLRLYGALALDGSMEVSFDGKDFMADKLVYSASAGY
jgi:hypothetical protein